VQVLCAGGVALWLAGPAPSRAVSAQDILTSVALDVRVSGAPVQVDLAPVPALRGALDGVDGPPIALAIEGLEGTTVQPVRLNVFLNKTDADTHTSTEDMSCVGFIQIIPVRGIVRRVGHAIEVSRSGGLQPNGPIRITIVPVVGTDSVPTNLSLRIGRIYLEQVR
jgi:hypothetical protein